MKRRRRHMRLDGMMRMPCNAPNGSLLVGRNVLSEAAAAAAVTTDIFDLIWSLLGDGAAAYPPLPREWQSSNGKKMLSLVDLFF